MDEGLSGYLDLHGIAYTIHKHKAVHTVAESREVDKGLSGMHCKTLFLKDDKDTFYLIGMKATKRLDIRLLERHFKIRKMRFASPEELMEELSITPGSVSIFSMVNAPHPENIVLIMDKEVWDSGSSGFHPNINTETLEISHPDLKRYFDSLRCRKEIISL